MRFLSDPPCARLVVERADDAALELVLAPSERVAGGITATAGGFVASVALRFLRTPLPLPLKLVPLAMAGVGGALGAAGAFTAASDFSVSVSPSGVCFRWKWGPLEAKELSLPADQIEDFEITRSIERGATEPKLRSELEQSFRLVLVTKAGVAYPFERFETHTQARLRRNQLEAILRPDAEESWLGR